MLTFDPIQTNAVHKQTSIIFPPTLLFFLLAPAGREVGYGVHDRCEMELYGYFTDYNSELQKHCSFPPS